MLKGIVHPKMKSLSPLTAYTTTTFKPHKGSKGIVKAIHVTPVVKPQVYEAMRCECFVLKKSSTNIPLSLKSIKLQCMLVLLMPEHTSFCANMRKKLL